MRKIDKSRICVVGGAGFLGSHLVEHLIEDRNCQVMVVDNLCVGRREFIHPKAGFVHHDITGSEEFLVHLFKQNDIEYVFNYAAWPYVPDCYSRPLQVFSVNANGAMRVINSAQTAGCKAILQVSSAELYGEVHPVVDDLSLVKQANQINEEDEVRPHSTYGAAKAAVDYYCQVAWRERNTPVISLRQFNCLGPRETHPYVVPEIISQFSRGDTIKLGNNSRRDFLYAGDAVRMATELLEKGTFGEVYNLGSTDSIRIYDLATRIGQIMGWNPTRIDTDPARVRPWEIWSLCSDNSKIYRVIESRPTVTLDQALRMTIDDFRSRGSKWCWEN